MRIAVVGAGAVGSVYGALLSRSGHDVTLVDVAAEQVDAINRDGIVLAGAGGDEPAVPAAASTDAAAARGAEAVLVLVKAHATGAAARSLAPHLGEDAIAVTLQNGLGNDRALAAVLGPDRVVAGATTVGAELLGPGRVAASPSALDGGSLTSLGAPPAGTPARAAAERLASALSGSGLPAELRDDVELVIWRKLAFTASMAPLCALLRCTVADALESEPGRRALRRMFDEVVAVAGARGVALDAHEPGTRRSRPGRGSAPTGRRSRSTSRRGDRPRSTRSPAPWRRSPRSTASRRRRRSSRPRSSALLRARR